MLKKIILIISIIVALFFVIPFALRDPNASLLNESEEITWQMFLVDEQEQKDDVVADVFLKEEILVNEIEKNEQANSEKVKLLVIDDNEEKIDERNVFLKVPFTPQAPFANWDDVRQQDGCEEASVLMAMRWIENKQLSLEEAEKEIIAISEYEKREYGEAIDTSVQDTVSRIIKGYFKYENSKVKEDINLEDIKQEIFKGNLVIVPMDGIKLNNPYYTPPGPERHMLVIRGYDTEKKEFITNDPGTKKGEAYYYPEQHFFNSIRDYLTGDHKPIEVVEKNIIIVGGE
ncbi:C39 family peptidase [Patescibacteria group bacterium]